MTTPDQPITYPATLEIRPLDNVPDAVIDVPGSKSITNRALILAALAEGESHLHGALDADDTRVMIASLQRLGIQASWEQARSDGSEGSKVVCVVGQGGHIPNGQADLFVGNSGTSIRFLTALCALGQGPYGLDGVARMRQRPQADLLDALQTLGVQAVSVYNNGCPPLRVESQAGLQGGTVRLRAEASSQFLTALLMVAPYAKNDVTIDIDGALRPFYVEITTRMMAQWGGTVRAEGTERFHIASGQRYRAYQGYRIEADASSASYFFAAAAITGGRVTVKGLSPSAALQGDVRFATEVLAEMGCVVREEGNGLSVTGPPIGQLRGIDRDMSAISDTSLTLAAIAPFANSPTTVRNIAHSRLQECDRVVAVCAELTRLGVQVEERPDGYTIYPINHPAKTIRPATVQTYHDHRVAMSFALVGLRAPGVVIADPGCVAKTFPSYWQTLERLRL
jgi:3-phosphoshikimate 1-carboxyvinyltransferase